MPRQPCASSSRRPKESHRRRRATRALRAQRAPTVHRGPRRRAVRADDYLGASHVMRERRHQVMTVKSKAVRGCGNAACARWTAVRYARLPRHRIPCLQFSSLQMACLLPCRKVDDRAHQIRLHKAQGLSHAMRHAKRTPVRMWRLPEQATYITQSKVPYLIVGHLRGSDALSP